MPDLQIEQLIFNNLLYNDEYVRKVLPYLKDEYFKDNSEKAIFFLIKKYFDKYNKTPTPSALKIELEDKPLTEDVFDSCQELIKSCETPVGVDFDWLVTKTEKFCQDRAIYNGIMESIGILEGKNKEKKDKGAIPDILQNALGVSFDNYIGHDFLDDAEERYDFYHEAVERIPFDIDMFNKITRGGICKKSLTVLLMGTGVGKTLTMCHMATGNLLAGQNVLYVTMEMAEERIAERIDANILNVPLDELELLPRDSYMKKVDRIKGKTAGKLVIKEYPTASVGVNHFRHLLNELKQKKKFIPDIIYIDYLNICASARMRMGSGVNTYVYVKAIAEEIRGLAVEMNLPIVTATQTNRTGFVSSDVGLEDTSESFGLPATADLMLAGMTNEELEALGQILFKQLKNRFRDVAKDRRFVVGVDRSKMRLYDVEQEAQENIMTDIQDHDAGGAKFDKSSFDGWK
jgi:replicative DNA helicase